MRTQAHRTVFRKDYQQPVYHIESVELGFDLDLEETIVATRLSLVRNRPGALVLNGEDLELLFVELDGRRLDASRYEVDDKSLSFSKLPPRCTLDIAVRVRPQRNTTLMGLYASSGNLFTQCEAEGFRRITYFPDRPDVMARYTVMLRADRKKFPVLLSNGNLIESGDLPGGRHYAKWEDPFPKPSYLFALVAGRLGHVERRITTQSGRPALLQVYAEKRDLAKVEHAMNSLVHSVVWDERRFGLELDLERFMIVAVGDFNMGAMENKGLNIFNTQFVLASPETATDKDFANIESVVGHEYFHNWTGNRVTCRDWFQLTLKEGLTVFRDQEFSADMGAGMLEGRDQTPAARTARAVNRIAAVRSLRAAQFPEDAGPMAHPIRPESYQEIGNFYTATVYQKGAEVVRMQQTLLGREGFREGLDEYFRRFDGQAVTCDDFVDAMESVYRRRNPGRDMAQFRRWYSQAGTPRVQVRSQYDKASRRYTLTFTQSCPRVGVERDSKLDKLPYHIPMAVGLLGRAGHDLQLRLAGDPASTTPVTTRILDLTEASQSFTFVDVPEKPVPSLLRDFSAPVIVDYDYSDGELAHLSAHDSDSFNRWEASQRLVTLELARLARLAMKGGELELHPNVLGVFRSILTDGSLAPSLKELALTLPSESMIGEQLPVYDPAAVHRARVFVRTALARGLAREWLATYRANQPTGSYSPEARAVGQRSLRNVCLSYLMELGDGKLHQLAWQQFKSADNMTDRIEALAALVNVPAQQRERALERYAKIFRDDPLALDKWLRVQAVARRVDAPVLEAVQKLTRHRAFSLRTPNKVYSLLGAFFSGNPSEFHREDGAGYAFWAEQVLAVDRINPSVAGRLARALDRWKKLTPPLQAAAKRALARVHGADALSPDVAEIVGKALRA